MKHLIDVALLGIVSGIIGTGTGGLTAFFVKGISNRVLGFLLEFPAGLMMAVVCFKLIPEAFGLGGVLVTLIGVFFGVAGIIAVESFISRAEFTRKNRENTGLLKAGILVAIGIALHNFPEGFAVGSGFEASFRLGVTITAVIIIHDIPEGIAMAVPMRVGGFSEIKSFILTLLSGLPMGLGALLGAVLGEISPYLTAACLGFAAGAMLYIVYGELIPESKKIYDGRLSSLGNVMGIICGIIVSIWRV